MRRSVSSNVFVAKRATRKYPYIRRMDYFSVGVESSAQ